MSDAQRAARVTAQTLTFLVAIAIANPLVAELRMIAYPGARGEWGGASRTFAVTFASIVCMVVLAASLATAAHVCDPARSVVDWAGNLFWDDGATRELCFSALAAVIATVGSLLLYDARPHVTVVALAAAALAMLVPIAAMSRAEDGALGPLGGAAAACAVVVAIGLGASAAGRLAVPRHCSAPEHGVFAMVALGVAFVITLVAGFVLMRA